MEANDLTAPAELANPPSDSASMEMSNQEQAVPCNTETRGELVDLAVVKDLVHVTIAEAAVEGEVEPTTHAPEHES